MLIAHIFDLIRATGAELLAEANRLERMFKYPLPSNIDECTEPFDVIKLG